MLYDIIIIGGGINGCSIARQAAKSGLKTLLLEKRDLAAGTSSASSKLIHGGLRYLEHYEFRLVRESLKEREIMWRNAPHIIYPMRFVLPYHDALRPQWMIRLGLFLYDHIGGRKLLPPCKKISLKSAPHKGVLQAEYNDAFEYSDCWVDDARLVILNAMDAAANGADILTHSAVVKAKVLKAKDAESVWHVKARRNNKNTDYQGKILINAAGPWTEEIINHTLPHNRQASDRTSKVKLIKGSHIITRKLFEHDKAYVFQSKDRRIIFAIPYEKDFTLIGTTDIAIKAQELDNPGINAEEIDYLCRLVNGYFSADITAADVISSYAGVRALYDDADKSASKLSRDYTIDIKSDYGAPLVNIFGGKITTARALAEEVSHKLKAYFTDMRLYSSRHDPLPGGDIRHDEISGDIDSAHARLKSDYGFLNEAFLHRLLRSYGSCAWRILGQAKKIDDLGQDFGHNLYAAEVNYLRDNEFATSADDILLRRGKLGLRFSNAQKQILTAYMQRDKNG